MLQILYQKTKMQEEDQLSGEKERRVQKVHLILHLLFYRRLRRKQDLQMYPILNIKIIRNNRSKSRIKNTFENMFKNRIKNKILIRISLMDKYHLMIYPVIQIKSINTPSLQINLRGDGLFKIRVSVMEGIRVKYTFRI